LLKAPAIKIYRHTHQHSETGILSHTVYIYRIFSNLICTSFCRFLKQKKKLVRGSNQHLWEDNGEDKDDSDWVTDNDSVMSDEGESDE